MERARERRLVDQAIAREPEAVRRLVDHLTPTVHAVVQRYVAAWAAGMGMSDWSQARDELYQEVMVALFADDARVLRRFDPERAGLRTYVRRVAANTCYACVQAQGAPPKEEWVDDSQSDGVDWPARAEATTELARILGWLGKSLGPTDLRLFHLLIVQERPFGEVSAETGFSVQNLHLRKFRLLKKIRSEWARAGSPEG